MPAMLAGVVMLAALKPAIRVPERWKIWAIETRSVPPSRDWSMFGSQAVPMSAPPVATTWTLLMFGPPSSRLHVEPEVLVVALVERGVVAGELRLGDPLELELDRRQPASEAPPLEAPALELQAATSIDRRDRGASTFRDSLMSISPPHVVGGRRLPTDRMSSPRGRW